MKQFTATTNNITPQDMAPCVATIGFFDGVHRGHQYLIKGVTDRAKRCGLQSAVITFDRHPRLVLNQEFQPKLLTTNDEKAKLLEATGVDNCVVLHFDESMAMLSAYDFMKDVLAARLNVRKLLTGYDNRFGHNRSEGFDDYVRYGRELGIEVEHADAFMLNSVQVSSSVVRSFLSAGEVDMAAMCLGYGYALTGTVVKGCQEGRKMGFPTANIDVNDKLKLIPEAGVYAVRIKLDGGETKDGMMNIGTRPTFNGSTTTLEVNIFDFDGDLYGQTVETTFVCRLRKEHKFASAAKLAEQLDQDRKEAQRILS